MAKRKKPRGGDFDLVNGWTVDWRGWCDGCDMLDLTLVCAYGDVTVCIPQIHVAKLSEEILEKHKEYLRRGLPSNVVKFRPHKKPKPVPQPAL